MLATRPSSATTAGATPSRPPRRRAWWISSSRTRTARRSRSPTACRATASSSARLTGSGLVLLEQPSPAALDVAQRNAEHERRLVREQGDRAQEQGQEQERGQRAAQDRRLR